MAGRMINGAAALAELVRPAGDTDEQGVHRVLPVVPELSGLLPSRGLRRGSTVAVTIGASVTTGAAVTTGQQPARRSSSANGPIADPSAAGGSTSLLLALLSAASQAGSWCAVVGVPALGALAAAESGIALERLALIPNPGPEWPTVVAALIDGVDVVVVAAPGPVAPTIISRLAARARQRGCVLVPYGRWDGADVSLRVSRGTWEGLGAGDGRLRRREVTVTARGRGAAARPKEITMWLPGSTALPPIPPPPGQATEPPPTAPGHRPPPITAQGPPALSVVPGGRASAVVPAPAQGSRPAAVASDIRIVTAPGRPGAVASDIRIVPAPIRRPLPAPAVSVARISALARTSAHEARPTMPDNNRASAAPSTATPVAEPVAAETPVTAAAAVGLVSVAGDRRRADIAVEGGGAGAARGWRRRGALRVVGSG